MQMDDILNAAIQDAGLETNLCSLLDNQCNTPFSTSSPSSSSCYTSFSKDLNNNDQDFNLNDLDFSFLTDASNDFLVSSSLDISSNSVSPIHNQDNQNYDFMLSDDPFLAVLSHFDQNNLNIESNEKTSSELRPNNGTHLEQKIPNRKIIKINSLKHSNQNLLPYSSVVKSGTPAPNQTNSTVRIVSISNRKKIDSPRSDLNSLINFRNPLKTFNVSTNAPKAPLNANPVKVINLSHLQQKNLQERLISTSACKRIIKIQNNQTENRSASTTGQAQHFSNQNIKITKVVSSKPVSFQNQSTTNMVFLNKTKNKLFHFNSNLNEIQKKPLVHEIKNKTVITKTFNSNNLTIPKVIMTPKTITSAKNQETMNIASKYGSYSSSSSVSSHLNALNSHLSRFANSNQATKETLVDIQTPESNATPINQQSIINGVKNNNQTDQPNEAKFVRNESTYERDHEVVVEEEEELGHAETYADYMPSKLKLGLKHPDPIVETSSLASVEPPDIWYELRMASSVYEKGALSALQLEAVVYACQKHSEFLPNSHRCGFLIGDGAGVGKGRTIAGIIYENYLQGRKKALWLSVSNDLKYDAQRDFSDIGASDIQIYALNKLKYSKISSEENSNIKKGVIFSTYSSLIGESQQKSENQKYSSRLEQLFQWLGGESFDGVIVFDECHKAKNLVPIGSAKPTKTGLAVLELQEKLPKARIVYASATGASEPKNMAYMVRLGLWGTGTPFNDFNDFIQSVEKRGVGAMEIIAIDMKLRGMYIARQLSFTGVTFKIQEIPLRDEYIRMYDDSVKLWVEMKEKFQEALDLIDLDGKMKKTVWGQFWSSHQRFFKYLCLACKVPSVVELAKKALNNHKCVVIGLQSTGEARTLEHIDEGGEMNDFVSTARGVLQNLVEKHFPSKQKKQVAKSPKISQNVNQIFKRLSSYTNPQKMSKKKHLLSESSVSSFDDSSFYDSDSFESLSSDLESAESNTASQYDSGLSSTYSKKSNSFDSDDSDSLFSITKSVPQQNVTTKKIKKPRNKLNKSPNKRKKPNTNIYGYDEFNDRIEDEDNDIQIIEPAVYNESAKAELDSESDEEFSLPVKRVKSNKEQDIFDIDDPFGFCISKPEQSNRPKPTEPNQIEQYIHEIKSDLLNAIKSFGKRLPANTLDELIDLLNGPDHVAEMTGRKGRIVSQKDSNNQKECYVYETRNENDVPVELMNFVQKERFMNGEKLVAIISEAASSGISLQANRRYANQLKRVHITIELPWSADRAIQQFGRTHRSNQVSSPEYIFLISQLAGEKRFASTVAKRLESLGALTHGDRRATESRDLSQFNIDNKYGRTALENVIRSICQMEKPLARFPNSYKGDFINDAREALHGVGMIVSNKKGSAYPEKDYNNINKFLNRLLGCPVNLQNAIFTFFSDVLTTVILQAKRSGKWDMGIMDLGSNNEIATRKETKFYVLNNKSDTCRKVELHTVLVERGISWEKALEIYRQNLQNSSSNEIGFYLLNQVKNNNRLAILAVPSQDSSKLQERKLPLTLSIYRPNTGLQTSFETFDSLNKKFKKVSSSEAKAHWIEHYRKSASECIHRFREGNCSNIRNCDIGLRTRKFYILAGSVLTVWSRVENLLCHLTGSSQFRLQIIRVRTSDNLKIVGCVIPAMCIKKIDSFLSSISSKSYVQTHMTSQVTANDDKKSTKFGAQNYKKSNMTCAGDYENTNFINRNSKNFNTSNEKNQFFNFDIT